MEASTIKDQKKGEAGPCIEFNKEAKKEKERLSDQTGLTCLALKKTHLYKGAHSAWD